MIVESFIGLESAEPEAVLESAVLLKRSERRFEGLFRLDREADRDVSGTVELFQHFITKQATELALNTGP